MEYKTSRIYSTFRGRTASESAAFTINDRFSAAFVCSYEGRNFNETKTAVKRMKSSLSAFLRNEDITELFTTLNPHIKMGFHYELLKTASESSAEKINLDKLSFAAVILDNTDNRGFASAHLDGRVTVYKAGSVEKIYPAHNYGFFDITTDKKIVVCNNEDSSADIFEAVKISF